MKTDRLCGAVLILAAMFAVATVARAGEMTKSCTLSPKLPNPGPVDFALEPLVTGVFTCDIVTPSGYEFLGAGPPDITGEGFVWTQTGEWEFKVTNTKWESAHTRVSLTARWKLKSEEGEGGGGSGPGIISRTGVGDAYALEGELIVNADPAVVAVGAEATVSARASDSEYTPALSDWTLYPSPPADFVGSWAGVSSVKVQQYVPGEAEVTAFYCQNPEKNAAANVIFVAVTSIVAEPSLVCVGDNVTYTITTDPAGHEAMVSYTPADTGTPGLKEVVAVCGSSSATCTVTVVKVTSLSASPDVTPIGDSNITYTITTEPADHTNMVTLIPADCDTAGSNIATAVCGSSTATCYVTVVKVKTLEYKLGAIDWTAMPSTVYSADGQSVSFRALPDPTNAAWPSGKPIWSTNVTANGSEASGAFSAPGTNTVSVECGNTASGVVVPLKITITPAATNIAANGGSAVFWLTNSSVGPGGVSWSINPTNGVALTPASDHVTVTPDGSTGLTYTVTAHCVDNTNVNCQATLNVLKVELTSGGSAVDEGGFVYIADTPTMPDLDAKLKPDGLPGQVNWRLKIEYTRNRSYEDFYPSATTLKTLNADQTWDITSDLGTAFRGGKATLYCVYQGQLMERVFHIRGNNPSANAVETEIGTSPWYAQPVAEWESDYLQFNTAGTLGPNPGDYKFCPNFGAPNGWGIFQLDTPNPTAQQLWKWTANVSEGKARLADPCRTEAESWMASQESQQQAEEPSMGLTNYVFTFNGVDFQKGTARTPVDACTIQRYNGAALWVIYWQNTTTNQPGSWQIRDTHRAYVDNVCGEVD